VRGRGGFVKDSLHRRKPAANKWAPQAATKGFPERSSPRAELRGAAFGEPHCARNLSEHCRPSNHQEPFLIPILLRRLCRACARPAALVALAILSATAWPALPASAAEAAAAAPVVQPREAAKFRDWSMLCVDLDSDAGTPEDCLLAQPIRASKVDATQLIMAAQLRIFTTKDSPEKKAAMIFLFPPAADKEAGITLAIDGKDLGKGPIAACGKEACQTVMVLSNELINLLKQGSKLTIVFTLKDKGPVAVPVSLLGFTAGIDALAKRS
jgi:invasion protein IalB